MPISANAETTFFTEIVDFEPVVVRLRQLTAGHASTSARQVVFTLSESIDDEREVDEGDEHDIQFVESREDAPEAFETTEQPFHFVSAFVHFPIVFPRFKAVALWRNNRDETQVQCELSCLVAFICLVHQQVQWPIGRPKALKQGSPLRCITGLSGRKRECYGCSSIRGNHMNRGGPSGPALADSLRSVFFNAPVPSGCTFTIVLSSETTSILTRTI